MISDGTILEIIKDGKHAWGYHPAEGVLYRIYNGFYAKLVLPEKPKCYYNQASGMVQDDTHWVTSLTTKATWREYFGDLKNVFSESNRNYLIDPKSKDNGWLFCHKKVVCNDDCKAAIKADYDNSLFWKNRDGAYGGRWKYSYPTFETCMSPITERDTSKKRTKEPQA
jgi:hypothetical protein